MLETERVTRGAPRAFVRYEDLLADWVGEIRRIGPAIEAPQLAAVERTPQVDRFVDPTLHRSRVRWDELDVPDRVRDMAEDVWRQVQNLATGGPTELDAARDAYLAMYGEAEAIAQSSITAAKPRRRRAEPAPSLRVRIARRIPKRYRRRIRQALGRA
jgi:hypothetical protein